MAPHGDAELVANFGKESYARGLPFPVRRRAIGVGLFSAVGFPQFFAVQRLLDANLHDHSLKLLPVGRGAAICRIVALPTYLRVERVEIGQLDRRDLA